MRRLATPVAKHSMRERYEARAETDRLIDYVCVTMTTMATMAPLKAAGVKATIQARFSTSPYAKHSHPK